MEVKLISEPNVIFETARMITYYLEKKEIRTVKEALRRNTRAEAQILDGLFDSVIEFTDGFIGTLASADREVLKYLFSYRTEIGTSLASYMLHSAFCSERPSFPEDVERVRSLGKATFFANMYSLLLERFPETESKIEITGYAEFINYIALLPISSDLKWELCSFYNNYENIRGVLADLLLGAGRYYITSYELVRHNVEWFTANYKLTAASDPRRFLLENYPEAPEKSPDVLYILPSVAIGGDCEYLMRYTGNTITDFLYIGVLASALRSLGSAPFDDRKICRTLRVIGDQSKFEILRLTAESPKYGIQLAEALGISTATISHHMNQLAEQGLVNLERDQNRVYYTANKAVLEELVSDLTRLFSLGGDNK